jgi:hypothetical protein
MADTAAQRMRRWRARHPQKVKAHNDAANARRKQGLGPRRDPNKEREHAQERYFRFKGRIRANRDVALRTVSAGQLDNPPLYFIDPRGRVWIEDDLSAEQLIAKFLACSHCAGDYEDPDATAPEPIPQEEESS